MKHLEVRQKNPLRVVFLTLFLVFHLVIKHSVSCFIYYLLDKEKALLIYVKRGEKFIARLALINTRFVIFGRYKLTNLFVYVEM